MGPYPRQGSYIKVLEMMDDDLAPFPLETIFSQRMLDEIALRVMKGAQKNSSLGVMEAQRGAARPRRRPSLMRNKQRRKSITGPTKTRSALHTRRYVGLGEFNAVVPNVSTLKEAAKTFESIHERNRLCQPNNEKSTLIVPGY